MSDYTDNFYTLAAKIQTAKGTPAAPTVSADAIRCGAWSLGPVVETVPTNESTGLIDDSPPVFGRARGVGSGPVKLKGSGTPEVPPDVGVLLRVSGMTQNAFGAAVTGTAQAGGATAAIKLAAGADATDEFYSGCYVEVTAGTNVGWSGLALGYVGSTKMLEVHPPAASAFDGTSVYNIPKQVVWRPRAAGTTYEYATVRKWEHRTDGAESLLYEVQDAFSTWKLAGAAGDLFELAFDVVGKVVDATDVTYPGRATFDPVEPISYKDARTWLNGVLVAPSRIEIDWGSRNELADDPNVLYGYGAAALLGRDVQVRLQLPKEKAANRNAFALARAAAALPFAVWWPVTGAAGTRFGVAVRRIVLSNPAPASQRGFSQETLAGGCVADGRRVFITQF